MSAEGPVCPRCHEQTKWDAYWRCHYCVDCGINVDQALQIIADRQRREAEQQQRAAARELQLTARVSEELDPDGIPKAIKRWSWPAFIFGWLWCFFNGLPVWGIASLLGWIFTCGFVGFFIDVWLGAKGNEYAWRANRYPSVAAYRRSQLGWEIMVWILVGTIVLSVAWIWLQFHR
jgi:hypothetical protein